MKLPRRLLHRIRRHLRRHMNLDHHQTEPLPGERSASPIHFARWILGLATAGVLLFFLAGCATVTTRVVTTDKAGTVTETVTTTKATDPAALALAGTIATAYAPPRARLVRQEKAGTPADLQRILRGRPVTKEEIANRWQPLHP